MGARNEESPERRTQSFQKQTGETTTNKVSYTIILVNRDSKKAIARARVRCLSCGREMFDAHVCTFCSCADCGKTDCIAE